MSNIDLSNEETKLSHATLPRGAQWLVGVAAVALGGLALVLGMGIVGAVVIGVLAFLIGYPLWALLVENRRSATDKLITGLVWTAFGIAVIPLIWLAGGSERLRGLGTLLTYVVVVVQAAWGFFGRGVGTALRALLALGIGFGVLAVLFNVGAATYVLLTVPR